MTSVLMDLKQIYQRLPLYFSFKRKKISPTSIFHFYGSRSLLARFKLAAVTRLELTITGDLIRECVLRYVGDIQRRLERGNHDTDGLDYIVFRIDWIIGSKIFGYRGS